MGNSNTTLQAIIDSISTIGDLMPVLVSTGGFSSEPALTIANDVVMEMFSEVAVRPDRAVIVVTHDNRVFGFGDRIVHMNDGVIDRVEEKSLIHT